MREELSKKKSCIRFKKRGNIQNFSNTLLFNIENKKGVKQIKKSILKKRQEKIF